MKVCKRCLKQKELFEFYKHKDMLDGYLNYCKECTKKRVKAHRIKNIDNIREYDRLRGRLEYRKKANRERNRSCNMSEAQKNRINESKKKWANNNKEKVYAQNILSKKLKKGEIFKPDKCIKCGSMCRLEAHHHDYTKPLDVLWLCKDCHSKEHRIYK
jgi:hypothetical protein